MSLLERCPHFMGVLREGSTPYHQVLPDTVPCCTNAHKSFSLGVLLLWRCFLGKRGRQTGAGGRGRDRVP